MPWSLHTAPGEQKEQTSFVGGRPKLPADCALPVCRLCSSQQTFFFQLAVPRGEFWEGRTVAVFACTSCENEEYLIPPMLNQILKAANIPNGFLEEYQWNFSFLIFSTEHGVISANYDPAIEFSEIKMKKGNRRGIFGRLGGTPAWVLEDESPSTYHGSIPMRFLMEIAPDFRFPRTAHSRPQMKIDLRGRSVPSLLNYYRLFLGNAVYLFGTEAGKPMVYAITQV